MPRRSRITVPGTNVWLQELGFVAGDSVLVHCEDGKIIVTKETALGETE